MLLFYIVCFSLGLISMSCLVSIKTKLQFFTFGQNNGCKSCCRVSPLRCLGYDVSSIPPARFSVYDTAPPARRCAAFGCEHCTTGNHQEKRPGHPTDAPGAAHSPIRPPRATRLHRTDCSRTARRSSDARDSPPHPPGNASTARTSPPHSASP